MPRPAVALFFGFALLTALVPLPLEPLAALPLALARLLPGALLAALAGVRLGWIRRPPPSSVPWLALALPFPYSLAHALYLERFRWMPGRLAEWVSGPTEFQLWCATVVFLALPWTAFVFRRSWATAHPDPPTGALRRLTTLLFLLAAGPLLLPNPAHTVQVMRRVVEPIAVGLCAAAWGRHWDPGAPDTERVGLGLR